MRWKLENKDAVRRIQRSHYHRNRDRLLERQRAYSKTPEGRAAEAAKRARQLREAPEKIFARGVVLAALRAGMLSRKPCRCGEMKVEAHHDDYTKPLEVEWLCKACHAIEHRTKGESS